MNLTISRRGKYVLSISLAVLTFATLVDLLLPETMALGWHLRHGSKTECCGVQLQIPLNYNVDQRYDSIMLFNTPGYLRSKVFHSPVNMIILSRSRGTHRDEDAQVGITRLAASFAKDGYRLKQKRIVTVVNKPLECWELYTDHLLGFGPQYQVWCAGMENPLAANFTGSPSKLDEFYSLLGSANSTAK